MKLYRVTAEFEFFVMAEDESDAVRVAASNGSEAFSDTFDIDYVTSQVTELREVPKYWRNCYPYGDGPDVTCEQILTNALSAGEQRG
jgi:hypothetical protein